MQVGGISILEHTNTTRGDNYEILEYFP